LGLIALLICSQSLSASDNDSSWDVSLSSLPDYLAVAERYDLPTDSFKKNPSGSGGGSGGSSSGPSSDSKNDAYEFFPNIAVGYETLLHKQSHLSLNMRAEIALSGLSARFPEGIGILSESVAADFYLVRGSVGPEIEICDSDKNICAELSYLKSYLYGELRTTMGSWNLKDTVKDNYFELKAALKYKFFSPSANGRPFLGLGLQKIDRLQGYFITAGVEF
jgi:hypothetical protein